ncbi:unnamed protein product [marine sediment metagenome]|uniref:Uncharacterized protein n=1 Tax=marine sediment metagenome TaxID=412755 RepID=X1UXW7_9ZZZZ
MDSIQTALFPILAHVGALVRRHAKEILTIENLRNQKKLEACHQHLREAQLDLVGLPDDLVAWEPPRPSA